MSHTIFASDTAQAPSVEQIVEAVLYEGYILYPYRAAAIKHRHRFNFGALYPTSWSNYQSGADPCVMRTECLVTGNDPLIDVRVRFLHPLARQIGKLRQAIADLDGESLPDYKPVKRMIVNRQELQSWQEVSEREIRLNGIRLHESRSMTIRKRYVFAGGLSVEPLRQRDGQVIGLMLRRQETVSGFFEATVQRIDLDLVKCSVVVHNTTPIQDCSELDHDEVTLFSLASVHTILETHAGSFVSFLETPEEYQVFAKHCENVRCWPVLVGEPGDRSVMLSSPVILYDYPHIASESPSDSYDVFEADELLAL